MNLEQLESFYMDGVADEVSGDVDSPTGHFYRVDRWIVRTDDRGFHDVTEYETIEDAKNDFASMDDQYSNWFNDEEEL